LVDILPPCTVVRFPFDFRDGSGFELKRFIVIGHVNDVAILIKTTSRVEYYRARPELLPGVAFCTAGEYDPFDAETIIDPANAFAVPHRALKKFYDAYTLDILGCVPELRDRLAEAITRNGKIEKNRKRYMLECLERSER
jgi:hypothetical protein